MSEGRPTGIDARTLASTAREINNRGTIGGEYVDGQTFRRLGFFAYRVP